MLQKQRSKSASPLLMGTTLLALTGCSPGSFDEKSVISYFEAQRIEEAQAPQEIPKFKAALLGLNEEAAGPLTATAHLQIKDGNLDIVLDMDGDPAEVGHLQNIHLAERCPDEEADKNEDGFIDAKEGYSSYGSIFLPLDGDLTDEEAGSEAYPVSDTEGNYRYNQTTSLEDLAAKKLNLLGKTIVIYGVAKDTDLPESVATIGDHSREESLPIACGQIMKASEDEGFEPQPTPDSETEGQPMPEPEPEPEGPAGQDDYGDQDQGQQNQQQQRQYQRQQQQQQVK